VGSDSFSFKQFTIFQGNTPMKVGTDSVLLGAWVEVENPKHILDVGTGTGLLALMMAQRFKEATIDAVELNNGALIDANNNFKNSPFSERIHLIEADFNHFQTSRNTTYDLIISNPPYFKNSLKSKAEGRNTARHQQELSLNTLLEKSVAILSKTGSIALILPEDLISELKHIAFQLGLHFTREAIVKSKPEGKIIRRMMILSQQASEEIITEEIILHEGGRAYSEAVKQLTADFYL
jgi:tRNA1Val (adenine37-N6)-methyltransferase